MASPRDPVLRAGAAMPDFELPDVTTKRAVRASDFAASKALLVAFICNHCPYVVHVRTSFVALAAAQQPRGLAVVAISANDPTTHPDDAPEMMAREAARSHFPFPYLFDETQQTAKAFGAACTPEFFLFDSGRHLVYHGRYDGTRPGGAPATGDELAAAIAATLSARSTAADQKPAVGCSIKWRAGNAPQYV